jgi:Fe-S cluster assembly protein SufD
MAARATQPRSVHVLSTVEHELSAFSAAAVHDLGGPAWLARRRRDAFDRFAASALPTGDEEVWRYSRIGDLDLGRFRPVSGPSDATLPPVAERFLEGFDGRAGLVVTSDGFLVTADLGETAAAEGVTIGLASERSDAETVLGSVTGAFASGETDAFADLADAFAPDAVVLVVPGTVEVAGPVVIVHVITAGDDGSAKAVFPRTLVHLADNAAATVVELLVSGDEAVLVLPTVELSAGDGARLTHDVVQHLGTSAWQIGRLFAAAGRDSTLKSFQASLGASYARMRTDSILTGQGGSSELLAAYFGDGDQMHDFRTLQEHVAPRTTSDLVFKGAVAGSARSVYSGLIHMRKGAKGANAFQTNRNLVLSDGAHADSVPNLDIEENDVRCSHASAVGPVDEQQRFYLESRGVPPTVAERLIVLGFFAELLERVNPSVRDFVLSAITERGAAVMA